MIPKLVIPGYMKETMRYCVKTNSLCLLIYGFHITSTLFLTWLLIFTPAGEGGVEVDPLEAAKMFSELSEQGHPFAQVKDKFVRI